MTTELKAIIRISRRARSASGWILTLGKPEYSVRFHRKSEAVRALRHALAVLRFEIKPAPKSDRKQPQITNLLT